jgi:hypothetical protein
LALAGTVNACNPFYVVVEVRGGCPTLIDPNAPNRDMVFVSHANTEDNEFSLWLSLRLAMHGYPVWCDLTKLLGGEDFWDDIQQALANRTIKFIFVLSRDSNKKDGTLQELAYAKDVAKKLKGTIKDFIITARIDDIPYDDIDIRVHRQNHISFHPSWHDGFATLLKKLEEDLVPQRPDFNPDAVCSWWRQEFSAEQGVVNEPEQLLSNWFSVANLPATMYEHVLRAQSPGPVDIAGTTFAYPAVWITDVSFLSFAKAEDFSHSLGMNLEIGTTHEHTLSSVISGNVVEDGPKHLAQLLRIAWDQRLMTQLPAYEMSTNQRCFYFQADMVPDDSIDFTGSDGKKSWRGIVGFKTVRKKRRNWHFGISARPIIRPETLFVIKGHVVFSDDGQNLWKSPSAMAKARRNQCRNWWNDAWRDRLLATMSFLAAGEAVVTFPLGTGASFTIAPYPIAFDSPVSYRTPTEIAKDELTDYEFEDEDDDDFDDA